MKAGGSAEEVTGTDGGGDGGVLVRVLHAAAKARGGGTMAARVVVKACEEGGDAAKPREEEAGARRLEERTDVWNASQPDRASWAALLLHPVTKAMATTMALLQCLLLRRPCAWCRWWQQPPSPAPRS